LNICKEKLKINNKKKIIKIISEHDSIRKRRKSIMIKEAIVLKYKFKQKIDNFSFTQKRRKKKVLK